MPQPTRCPNRGCPHHHAPGAGWKIFFGSYLTIAHGRIRRYQCRICGTTMSDQTESLHYCAKRRVPLRAMYSLLLAGASQREIARRYGLSCVAVHNAVLRLGRQAMAAHLHLLAALPERPAVTFDGLRSCITSQDYPCDITTVVEPEGEMILSLSHAIMRRGGRMTRAQRRRVRVKYRRWRPRAGSVQRSISLIGSEIADYLRPPADAPATIDTDEHPGYKHMLTRSPIYRHLRTAGQLIHRRTPSTAPRTTENRLFPVNYVDRLIRHRLREHTRETIAIGRNAVMQMHRAWLFTWDHNAMREHRVKRPDEGVHAHWSGISETDLTAVKRQFFQRRLRPPSPLIPETIRRVWLGELQTPPVRWRLGQRGTMVRIPGFAVRDLASPHQQDC
mgnify:FL=1